MTKAIIVDAEVFKSLRTKLELPAWVRPPIKYPCVFVWTWCNDSLECAYIYREDFAGSADRGVILQQIIEVVSKVFCLDAATVTSPSRHQKISDARAVICHEARLRAYTFKEIGAALNRTHKSVYNMQAKYYDLRRHDEQFDNLAKEAGYKLRIARL